MSSYALRFVGQEGLSNRLSDFDLNQFFQLTSNDIAEINEQFRAGHRAPAALMVLFLRAAGRSLDSFAVLPRNLLRYVGETFKTAAPTIATQNTSAFRDDHLRPSARTKSNITCAPELAQIRTAKRLLEVKAGAAGSKPEAPFSTA